MSNLNNYLKNIVKNEKPNKMLIGRSCEGVVDGIINNIKKDKEITFGEFLMMVQVFQRCVDIIVHIDRHELTINTSRSMNPINDLEYFITQTTGRKIHSYSSTITEMNEKLKGYKFNVEIKETETFKLDDVKDIINKIKDSRK